MRTEELLGRLLVALVRLEEDLGPFAVEIVVRNALIDVARLRQDHVLHGGGRAVEGNVVELFKRLAARPPIGSEDGPA